MSNSSPPPFNRLPAWFLFVAAIGVPSAAGLTFARSITQHPWQALGIAMFYELTVLIFGIVAGVWQQLQNSWVKRIADNVDTLVQDFLSSYQKHYCQYLFYQHRDFDVKGLSTIGTYTLDLEQTFVELSIDPKAPHETSADPLNAPEALNAQENSIWHYLTLESLTHQHLVIIGAPGCGKTTLLKHIVLTLVRKKKYIRRFGVSYKLPFLLFLRDHASTIKSSSTFSLVDAVQTQVSKWEWTVPSGWIERQLKRGSNLILLDGLDEVADQETRLQVVDWVQRQIVAYSKNRFVVTSRPFGYRSNPLGGVTVLEVRPFTTNQIELFIHNWYLANEVMSSRREDPGIHMRAKDGAEDLLARLRNMPTLFGLAVNPLLLTMIATVHRYRGSLPGTRVALYAEICEVSLGKRQEARGLTVELSPAQKMQILEPLAYHMMLLGTREISHIEAKEVIREPLESISRQIQPEAFLQLVENTSGLLLEKEQGVYHFAHLTFQEYLAAMYIRECKLENTLIAQIETSWWHEAIRLYCAQADATPIIVACLGSDRPSVSALTLALECQDEALKVQPIVSSQLETLLNWGIEDADIKRRRTITEALLNRRIRRMIHLKADTYRDTSLITCAEYQIFLDEQQEHSIYYQPDHWRDIHFPAGYGQTPILGIRPSAAIAFCKWLTEREQGTWQYRLPKQDELGDKIGPRDNFDNSVTNIGYWIEGGVSFSWIENTSIIKAEILKQLPIKSMLDQTFTSILRDLSILNIPGYTPGFSTADTADAYVRSKSWLPSGESMSDTADAYVESLASTSYRKVYSDLQGVFGWLKAFELHQAVRGVSVLDQTIGDLGPLDLDCILNHARELIHYMNCCPLTVQIATDIFDQALKLVCDIVRALDFIIDCSRPDVLVDAQVGNLAIDLNVIINLTFDRLLNLILDLAHVLGLVSTSSRDSSLNLACNIAADLDYILAHALNLALDFAYITGYSPASHLAYIRYLIRALIHYLDIIKDLAFAYDQPFNYASLPDQIDDYNTLLTVRAYVARIIITLKAITSNPSLRKHAEPLSHPYNNERPSDWSEPLSGVNP